MLVSKMSTIQQTLRSQFQLHSKQPLDEKQAALPFEGTDGQILTLSSGLPEWVALLVPSPKQVLLFLRFNWDALQVIALII